MLFDNLGMAQPKQAIVADVTATLTAQTPWGVITQVETGKYWRSSKGQIRQRDQHGLSHMLDLGTPRSQAWVDNELGIADVDKDSTLRRRRRLTNPSGSDWMAPHKTTKTGQRIVDGLPVTVREVTIGSVKHEAWSSDELKLVLVYRMTSGTIQFEQRYSNIRLAEPEPGAFDIPDGFKVNTGTFGQCLGGALRVTESISGQRGQTSECR